MRTISRSLLSSALLSFCFAGAIGCAADVDGDIAQQETTATTESALVASTSKPVAFVGGSDRNWFNPKNWSTGRVPGPTDDVDLDGRDDVIIGLGPNGGAQHVRIGELKVRGTAMLEVVGGTIFEARSERIEEHGRIIFRGSSNASESLVFADGADGNPWLNPSTQSHRDVILKTSVTSTVGLGGNAPASLARDASGAPVLHAGPGHYATTIADSLAIDGQLRVSLHYGFTPRAGDTFQIMTANRARTGEFIGLPEGSIVGCTEDAVCLRITYVGGDGNDIVLSAEDVDPEVVLLLPAVQKVREAAAR